jgi:2-amino-4-hydroxy-6-hydroxymethyldihydropteridine diphosphokinase
MASWAFAGLNKGPSNVRVAIALGSNLGDRSAHLHYAVTALSSVLSDISVSSFIDTDPVGVAEPQPRYLNAVVVGETTLEAPVLLEKLLATERERGRDRPGWRASRTLDLDLVLYGDLVASTPELRLPHPRFRERAFVLEPLAEVAPDWRDPVTGKTISELCSALGTERRTERGTERGTNGEPGTRN